MDFVTALSIILGTAGVTGQLVMAHRPIVGWSISIAVQPVWYALTIATGAYGLLVLNTGYLIAAIINLRKAIADRRRSQDTRQSTLTPAAQ